MVIQRFLLLTSVITNNTIENGRPVQQSLKSGRDQSVRGAVFRCFGWPFSIARPGRFHVFRATCQRGALSGYWRSTQTARQTQKFKFHFSRPNCPLSCPLDITSAPLRGSTRTASDGQKFAQLDAADPVEGGRAEQLVVEGVVPLQKSRLLVMIVGRRS